MIPRRWIRSDISAILLVGLLTQILTVVSGPLVARMLGPGGRGDMVMSGLVSIIVAHLASTSLTNGVAAVIAARHGTGRDLLGATVGRWTLLSLIPTLIAVGIGWALLPHAPHRLVVAIETGVITFLACYLNLQRGMLQGEHAVKTLNTSRIYFSSVYVAAVVVLFTTDRVSSAAAVLPTQILAQLVALVVGRRGLTAQSQPPDHALQRRVRQDIYRFTRQSYLSSLGTTDLLGIDSLLVGLLLGNAALGLYSVAVSTSTLPAILLTGLSSTLLPRMTSRDPKAAHALMWRWLLVAAGVGAGMALGLQIIIGPAMRILFGTAFVPATIAARLLIFSFVFSGLKFMAAAAAQAQGQAVRASALEVGSGVLMIVSVIYGATHHGVSGAAAAMLLTQIVSCLSLILLINVTGTRRIIDEEDQRTSTTSTL